MILTTEQAASHVGVSEATVRQWVTRGHLDPLVPGASPLRFNLLDVADCHSKRQPKAWHDRLDRLAEKADALAA